jgi:mycothiol synthase
MTGIFREFRGREDCLKMMGLVTRNPANSIHALDMPYRLSSTSLDEPRGVGLWENEAGELIGFAVIQWAWQTFDYGYAPDSGLEQQILAWAIERFPQLSKNYLSYERPLLFIDAPQDDSAKISLLEMNGFKKHPWQTTHFIKSLAGPLPGASLPPGFSFRPVANAAEYVKIHQAAFESTSMTIEWRERVEKWPQYRPELNVVAVAPDQSVVAFCSGWLGRFDPAKLSGPADTGLTGQIEPMGVHPDYRGRKLGRAVLEEVFRQMKAEGSGAVIVETDNFREEAQRLYRAAGFEQTYLIYKYSREF